MPGAFQRAEITPLAASLRLILVGARPPEEGENPVAEKFGDMTLEAGHYPGHCVLVGGEAMDLGVQAQITEIRRII